MPTTPQELWNVILTTVSSSRYNVATSGIATSGAYKTADKPKSIQNIILRTKDRTSLHDSVREFLNSINVQWEFVNFGSSSIQTFKVTSTVPHTRILVKPISGNEWLKTGFRNTALENLKNNNPQMRELSSRPDNPTEYEIIKKFNSEIEKLGHGSPVDVLVKDVWYKNIIGMIPGPFGHKADFIGLDKDGKGQFFISHKDGTNSKSFQQYSGISSVAGNSIYNHEEVQKFRKSISEKTTEEFYSKGYYKQIEDTTLKQRAVFGKDFNNGKNKLSSNNINLFAQGQVILTIVSRANKTNRARVRLNFSTKLITRRQIGELRGEYEPTLFARQGEAYRTVEYGTDDGGSKVRGVRAGIFTKGYIDGRKGVEPIE